MPVRVNNLVILVKGKRYVANIHFPGAIKGPMGKHQWEVTLGNLTKDTFLIVSRVPSQHPPARFTHLEPGSQLFWINPSIPRASIHAINLVRAPL